MVLEIMLRILSKNYNICMYSLIRVFESGSVLTEGGHVIMRTYDTKTLPDDVVYYEVIKRQL